MSTNKYVRIIANQQTEVLEFDINTVCLREEEKILDLDGPLAQVVIGVRRCGKSTFCHTALKNSGKNYAYVNFDDERLSDLKKDDLDNILEVLYIVYGDFKYLFLDEVQNIDGWHLFVNRLLRQKMHIIVTGSNAKLLSSELSTYLTGRYNKIELFPFSFSEYIKLKEIKENAITTKEIAFLKRAFNDYLKNGGFPELLNFPNSKQYKTYIQQLVNSVITIDIVKRFNIRYIEVLKKLTNYMISNFAQEINYKSLATFFGLGSHHTAENYINYLCQAYLLVGINKFSFKAKERIRSEKFYIIDPSLATQKENNLSPENSGWLLENIVYIELLRRKKTSFQDIYYYRKNYEIDFVLCNGNNVEQLIQVSLNIDNEKTLKREINALIKGSTEMNCTNLLLLTTNNKHTHIVNNLTINEINIIDWLLNI